MTNSAYEELTRVASTFRTALEASANAIAQGEIGQDNPRLAFREFPKGCCGESSLWLKEILEASGFSDLRCMVGHVAEQKHEDVFSHVWIESKDWLIDVTADQFSNTRLSKGVVPPVLVTQNKHWHHTTFPQMQLLVSYPDDFVGSGIARRAFDELEA